jgi:hypothetical protein
MFNDDDDDSAIGDLISVSRPKSDDFTDDDDPMDVDHEPVRKNKATKKKARVKGTATTSLSRTRPATKRKVKGNKTKSTAVGIDDESGDSSHKCRKDEQVPPTITIKEAPVTTTSSAATTLPQSQGGVEDSSLSDPPPTSPTFPTSSTSLTSPTSPLDLPRPAPLSTDPLAPAPVSTPHAQSDQPAGLEDDRQDKVSEVDLAGPSHEMGRNDSQDWNDGDDHESQLTEVHDEQPQCLISDPFDDVFNKRAPVAVRNLGTSVTIPEHNKRLSYPCALKPGASTLNRSSTCSEGSQSTQAGTSHPQGQIFNPVPLGSGPAHSAKFSSKDRMQQQQFRR